MRERERKRERERERGGGGGGVSYVPAGTHDDAHASESTSFMATQHHDGSGKTPLNTVRVSNRLQKDRQSLQH